MASGAMRITGGSLRGRRLDTLAGQRVRPTASRTREALFNLLAHGPYAADASPMPQDAVVLDAFAGAGTLGFEALSRGARHATFLDTDRDVLRLIAANARSLGVDDQASILRRDATQPGAAPRQHDLLFLDAPYDAELALPALEALHRNGWLAAGAIVVIEQAKRRDIAPPPGFAIADDRTYGAARLIVLRAPGA